MKIVAIADTHGLHRKLDIPDGDVLVHAGDFTGRGTYENMLDFASWVSELPHKHKIVVAGNHDAVAERKPIATRQTFSELGITYLRDDTVNIEGTCFYGSPWTPTFYNWHFMADRGKPIAKKWSWMPLSIDVLITHGPPQTILDSVNGKPQGCADLLERVKEAKPKYHLFGHIHEHHGSVQEIISNCELNGITFVNCSVLDERYKLGRNPVVFETT